MQTPESHGRGAGARSSPALRILAGLAILAFLYLARDILVPAALAGLMCLQVAPFARLLRRLGLGRTGGVLGAVTLCTVVLFGVAAMLVSQAAALTENLPQYEATLQQKIAQVQVATLGRVQSMEGAAGRVFGQWGGELVLPAGGERAARVTSHLPVTPSGAVPVEIHERPLTPLQLLEHLAATIWGPLGETGIVLVILVFALMEIDALRDRFIRLTGATDLRTTTHAITDAGERLSRLFASQLAVNAVVGALVALGLALLGVPQALLWGGLTGLLRFVPYLGVPMAALGAALMAAAVDPGWLLVGWTLGLFAVVELAAGQVVEPVLYGQTSGLSPLSVIIAAVFWSWLWGPIGLLLSTPLTLCLVVAGRHVPVLAFLDIMLGDSPALTLSQRFYQRALAGDAEQIVSDARDYLRRRSFAHYCDMILVPALRLVGADHADGGTTPEQYQRLRNAIVAVIESLGPGQSRRRRRHRGAEAVTDPSLGQYLRHRREDLSGPWQGPLDVRPASIALCLGLGSQRDELMTELLVRILRSAGLDARHVSLGELQGDTPPGARRDAVAVVFVVHVPGQDDSGREGEAAGALRERFPGARLVGVELAPQGGVARPTVFGGRTQALVHDFQGAMEQARAHLPVAA